MTLNKPTVDDHARFALDATETGLWEWDLDAETLLWDETCERLFGYEPGSFPGTYDAFLDRVLRNDRDAVETPITTAIETGTGTRWIFESSDLTASVGGFGVAASSKKTTPVSRRG